MCEKLLQWPFFRPQTLGTPPLLNLFTSKKIYNILFTHRINDINCIINTSKIQYEVIITLQIMLLLHYYIFKMPQDPRTPVHAAAGGLIPLCMTLGGLLEHLEGPKRYKQRPYSFIIVNHISNPSSELQWVYMPSRLHWE